MLKIITSKLKDAFVSKEEPIPKGYTLCPTCDGYRYETVFNKCEDCDGEGIVKIDTSF